MKTTININNQEVEIQLTTEQVEAIKKASEKITDRVKTFDDALKIVGASDNLKTLLSYNGQDTDMIASVAHAKLGIVAKALNQGWQPDWRNSNEAKYYPWFKTVGSGVGFSCHDYYYGYSSSGVGSRLVFKSSELAVYAGKQFIQLYNDLFTL
ncbi:hypothetical protein [Pedobacter arcticus]|uniref:hypothetical protein n=1 Tax=Pedobacter arcticus TaxID=752140 RepID=UPI0002FBB3EA|nr:hypothetical protein [Pedobacter arcticus]